MNISYIETSGELSILFNKDMIYPASIDQVFYNRVMRMTFQSSMDSSISYTGVFSDEPRVRSLAADDQTAKYRFGVRVVSHDER